MPLHARSIKNHSKGKKKFIVKYHHSLPFCFPFPCLFFISKENKCVICLLKLWYFFWSGMCFLQNTPEKWNSVLSLKEYYKTWRFRSLCSKVKYSAWQITDLELTTLDLLNLSNWTLWNCIEKPNQIWLYMSFYPVSWAVFCMHMFILKLSSFHFLQPRRPSANWQQSDWTSVQGTFFKTQQ